MSMFDDIFRKTGKTLAAALGAFAALLAAGTVSAAPQSKKVESVDGVYGVGDEIPITLELDNTVKSAPTSKSKDDYPNIVLDIDHSGSGLRYAYADIAGGFCDDYEDDPSPNLYFIYKVQPGDNILLLNCIDLNPNNADVTTVSRGKIGRPTKNTFKSRCTGSGEGALPGYSNVRIRTMTFQSSGTPELEETPRTAGPYEVVVSRGGKADYPTTFNVSTDPASEAFVMLPKSLTISEGNSNVVLPIEILGATADPVVVTLHPQGCRDDSGDLSLTLHLAGLPPPPDPYVSLSVDSPVNEGGAETIGGTVVPTTVTLFLSKPPARQKRFSIFVSSGDAGKIQLPGLTVTVPANQTTASFRVQPLDGDATVTLKASDTASPKEYIDGTCDLTIVNLSPVITGGTFGTPEKPVDEDNIIKGGEGNPYTISWSAKDVPADTLSAEVIWGDGSRDTFPGQGKNGSASHSYQHAGAFGVTIIVTDKDGASSSVSGTVTIEPATQVLVHEYKHGSANSYKGLSGRGRGTVGSPGKIRFPVSPDWDWAIKFATSEKSGTLVATPEPVDIAGKQYQSFFHVWIGEVAKENGGLGFSGKNSVVPIAPASAQIKIGSKADQGDGSIEVGAVFSREFLPGDGCGDIDQDALPDLWEKIHFSSNDVENAGDVVWEKPDRRGNGDGDFLPKGVNPSAPRTGVVTLPYPLRDYSPTGIGFANEWEVRGLNPGLNMRGGAESIPKDEPRHGTYDDAFAFSENDNREFFGTDPTVPDTDGDGLTDGWEYYFWYLASFSTNSLSAERWDPASVITGTPISNGEIAAAFHPLIPGRSGQDGGDFSDFDGDGLSDYEEMLLGTNPCHWDTDGDGMNDGWETMWGLDPLDRGDADGNPDGDWMAFRTVDVKDDEGTVTNTVALRHADVREAYLEYRQGHGYDPRTAWVGDIAIERSQSRLFPAPDTVRFTNWEEHYLGRWCLEHGITTNVPPVGRDYMTQPTPKGTPRWTVRDSVHSVTASDWVDSAAGTNGVNGRVVADAGMAQVAISTHGYDSDGDGMPDGWELYCFQLNEDDQYSAPFYDGNLWPTSWSGGSADDAGRDYDHDGLSNLQECHSSLLVGHYRKYDGDLENVNEKWLNKFWPTNPFGSDTDMDGVPDKNEMMSFDYATAGDGGSATNAPSASATGSCHPGGGLNPCTVDTDGDFIPDCWEAAFPGGFDTDGDLVPDSLTADPGRAQAWCGGMDGTVPDADKDYDRDGLLNYQEYWTGAVPHFHYSRWNSSAVLDITHEQALAWKPWFWEPNTSWDEAGAYKEGDKLPERDPEEVLLARSLMDNNPVLAFGGYRMDWDWSYFTDGTPLPDVEDKYAIEKDRYWYMPGLASTSPSDPDSDNDGMDDYYEMFHGLNPLLGSVLKGDIVFQAGESFEPAPTGDGVDYYDFRQFPWLAGDPQADPDQDGIPSYEEALIPSAPSPQPAHTDPSPLWMTDMSYKDSFVNRGYTLGWVPMYWATGPKMDCYEPDKFRIARPSYMYDFEMNEGYDTDNDSIGDKSELMAVGSRVTTDPLNTDSPGGHKSLYLDGDSAARTLDGCRFGPYALRSWTIQMWVKPERVLHSDRQVLIERPVFWRQKDTEPSFETVRRTFRLGIETDGRPFVEFDNGGTEAITENATADKSAVLTTNWTHVAATMDGADKRLSLYVNGELVASKSTALIPYSGFFFGTDAPSVPAPIVIGAADDNPFGRVDGQPDHYHAGVIFDRQNFPGQATSEPRLSKYFKGWIDEVSVWSGARTAEEIHDDYEKLTHYRVEDIISMREKAVNKQNEMLLTRGVYSNPYDRTFERFYEVAQWLVMETGAEDHRVRVQPAILAHYDFDALPDHRSDPPEPVLARGYEMLNGRPADYTGVPFWEDAQHRSTIYQTDDATPYLRLPFIKNTVSMLPKGHMMLNRERSQSDVFEDLDVDELETFVGYTSVVITNLVKSEDLTKAYFVADSCSDSVYWRHFHEGGVTNRAGFENTFPNSANPYGITYRHGSTYSRQRSIRTIDEVYDSTYATLFNDLLPLKGAMADGQVQGWDDSRGTEAGRQRDTDGDGLTDAWELANGMDPFKADQDGNGIKDSFDDFDSDGLSNGAEQKAGTDPWDVCTAKDGAGDYHDNMAGFFYTDHDYVDDGWESLWDDDYASSGRYDEHLDLDGDGWDNWSESLVTNNSARAEGYTRPDDANEAPSPVFIVDLDYGSGFLDANFGKSVRYNWDKVCWERWDGAKKNWVEVEEWPHGPDYPPPSESLAYLVVYVYSDEMMNGRPDAVYAKAIQKPVNWPLKLTLTQQDLEYGQVRQGRNWFFGFIDLDKSILADVSGSDVRWYTWTKGEPAGIADGQWRTGIDVGYDINRIRLPMTDSARSYARLSWKDVPPVETGEGLGHTVTIKTDGDRMEVFRRFIEWPRAEIHEGDFMATKDEDIGLGASVEGVVSAVAPSSSRTVYVWLLDGREMGLLTNYNDLVATAPVPVRPVNDVVYDAKVRFEFRLSDDVTDFGFELYRGNTPETSALVYSGRFQAPGRTRSAGKERDLVKWTFPYRVGDTLPAVDGVRNVFSPSREPYFWRVIAYSPLASSPNLDDSNPAVRDYVSRARIASGLEQFHVAPSDESNGNPANKGMVFVNVKYHNATNFALFRGNEGVLRVQAFRNPAFSGEPEAQVACRLVPSPGLAERLATAGTNVCLKGLNPVDGAGGVLPFGESLPLGNYYLRAFVDQCENSRRDFWEPWGYYRSGKDSRAAFRPVAAEARKLGDGVLAGIVLQDCDTDNDKLPDSVEWIAYERGSVADSRPERERLADGESGAFLRELGFDCTGDGTWGGALGTGYASGLYGEGGEP